MREAEERLVLRRRVVAALVAELQWKHDETWDVVEEAQRRNPAATFGELVDAALEHECA